MSSGKSCSSIWLVLHLTPRKRGSMEEQLVALAQRMRTGGVKLTCVFAGPAAPWLDEALTAAGVSLRRLDFARPFGAAAQLYRWLAEAQPEVVHFHFVRAHSPLVAAARLAGARVLVNDHLALHRTSPLRELFKRARTWAVGGWVDLRVAVSRQVAESVVGVEHVDARRVAVLENGIALERFSGTDEGALRRELGLGRRPIVACVARLAEEKGIETALRMMPLLGRDAVLLLVGDGPETERFRALAGELGLGESVRFLGLRNDVERVLSAADVVVVPSHVDEAFGLSLVEAMAAGRAVVVSRSGAMPELVGDGGLVVARRDPAELAAAVGRLLDDEPLRALMGRSARTRAHQRFGMSRYLDELCALYRRTCPSLFVGRPA